MGYTENTVSSPLQSVKLSNVLFAVGHYDNKAYSSLIASEVNKGRSLITQQLYVLKEAGWVTARKEEYLNKTIFKVNWENVVKAFRKMILESYSIKDDSNWIKKGVKNQYLHTYIRKYFSGYYIGAKTNVHYQTTLAVLFDRMFKVADLLHEHLDVPESKNLNKKEWSQFEELIGQLVIENSKIYDKDYKICMAFLRDLTLPSLNE